MASGKDFIFNLLADSSKAEKTIDGFSKFAGKAAVGLASAWAGAKIGEAISSSMDIEDANAKMSASLGLTVAESERIGALAGKVFSQNYGESVDEVNVAIESVMTSFDGMSTASSADIEAMTIRVMNFAKAFEVDVTRASQVASQMVTQGLAVDGTQALDLLTKSMQNVPIALREDLLDATDEYGGFFTQLGFSGEKSMSMLVAASAKGMYGVDKTGDALKEFTLRSTDMSAASVGAYDLLGLSAQDMSNKILAGGTDASGAFDQIVTGLLGIEDPALRANTAITLFGTPLEDLGLSDVPKFLESLQGAAGGLGEVAGATDAMGEVLNDTRSNRLESMKREMDLWVQGMLEVPGPMADITAGLTIFGPGLLQAVAALGPMAYFMGGPMVASLGAAGSAVVGFGTALLTSPVTWIVLGIVAAIALLAAGVFLVIDNWGTIGPWLGDLFTGIWKGIQWFFGIVTEGFLNFTPLGLIIKNWGGITEWFGNFWSGIGDGATHAAAWIEGKVGQIVGFFTSIPDRVGAAWTGLTELVSGVMRNVANFTIDAWNNTLGNINMTLPWFLGGAHIQFPKLGHIPALAAGGVALGPTLALIGEAGPEAVVPLNRASQYGFGDGGGTIETVIQLDGKTLARSLRKINSREDF